MLGERGYPEITQKEEGVSEGARTGGWGREDLGVHKENRLTWGSSRTVGRGRGHCKDEGLSGSSWEVRLQR